MLKKLAICAFCAVLWQGVVAFESQAAHEGEKAADDGKYFDTFTLYWENDFFTGTDRDYSNGIKLTWSTPYAGDREEKHLPAWSYPLIDMLPFVDDPSDHRAVSFSIGQKLFTPEEVWRSDLIIDDRPYAGYLYFAAGFHNRALKRKDSWELQFGVVGPLAFGEETQDAIHGLLDNNKPQGWDHQLRNEPAIEIICESQFRAYESPIRDGFNFDLIPHLGFRVGNVQTYANIGAEIRYGWKLPPDFGSCPIRAGCASYSAFSRKAADMGKGLRGWHVFAATDARMVAYDIFLDGNTHEDSHSVERKPFVADLMAGFVLDFGKVKTTYSYVLRTRQFEKQDKNHQFGSLTFSMGF